MIKKKSQKKNRLQRSAAEQQMRRRSIVSRLWLRRYTYRAIRLKVMEELGLQNYSLQTVKADVDACREEMAATCQEQLRDGSAMVLTSTADIINELWTQYEVDKSVKGVGDPKFLAEIRANQQELCKLLGLYAPEKKDVSGDLTFGAFLMESGVIDSPDTDNGL